MTLPLADMGRFLAQEPADPQDRLVNVWEISGDGPPDAPWRAVLLAPLLERRRVEYQTKTKQAAISLAKWAPKRPDSRGNVPPTTLRFK
jgi:hypothetical protein